MRLIVPPLIALLLATPAAAQINGTRQASASQRERGAPMARSGWSGELAMLDRDASAEREAGAIGRREARAIHRQERRIRAIGARYAASGLTEAELDMLEAQAFALR